MRKILAIILLYTLIMSLPVYADEKDERIAQLESQVEELRATFLNLRHVWKRMNQHKKKMQQSQKATKILAKADGIFIISRVQLKRERD